MHVIQFSHLIGKCYSQILLQFCALSSDCVFSKEHLIINCIGISTKKSWDIYQDLGQPQLSPLTTWPSATVEKKIVAIVERTTLEVTGWKAPFDQLEVSEESEYEGTGNIQLWILDWALNAGEEFRYKS